MRRCFVTLPDGRQVHYRRHGSGPPLVLFHESPETSLAHVPLMEQLGDAFTTIALDTPGRGLSDPLPLERPEIADYAASHLATIEALGLAGAVIYGNHTGALIALEVARRAPERIALAVIDGLPLFEDDVAEELSAHYAPPIDVQFDGSHLVRLWSRARTPWFPWCRRDPEHRMSFALPPPDFTQVRILHQLRGGGDGYRLTFNAAFRYRPRTVLPQVRTPLALVCRDDDLQASSQVLLPAGFASEIMPRPQWLARIRELVAAHSTLAAAPEQPAPAHRPGGISRAFADTADGQLLVRRVTPAAAVAPAAPGRTGAAPRPVVLLTAAPGSGRLLEPLLLTLGAERPAFAIDLPGQGDSDRPAWAATGADRPSLARFADAVAAALVALGVDGQPVDVVGTHAGAAVAAELAVRHPDIVHALVLDDIAALAPPAPPLALTDLLPPLEATFEGGHLLRAWAMTSDAALWSPWADRRPEARIDLGWDAQEIHERAVDLLLAGETYALPWRAALEEPWQERLAAAGVPFVVAGGAGDRAAAVRAALAGATTG